VPAFTKLKARKLDNYGRFEHYRYADVKAWLETE